VYKKVKKMSRPKRGRKSQVGGEKSQKNQGYYTSRKKKMGKACVQKMNRRTTTKEILNPGHPALGKKLKETKRVEKNSVVRPYKGSGSKPNREDCL